MKKLIILISLVISVHTLRAQTPLWSPLSLETPVPSARYSMGMSYLSTGKVLLFGGMGNEGSLGDTWIFDTGDLTWHEVIIPGTKPSARYAPGCVSLGGGKVLLFGGCNDENVYFNDVWIFNGSDNTWTEVTPAVLKPAPRKYPGLVCMGDTGILLCGGEGLAVFTDVWIFHLASNTWEYIGEVPEPRFETAVCRIGTNKAALIGGNGNHDLWIYDISANTWSYRNPSEYPPIAGPVNAVYMGGDAALVLAANDDKGTTETWIYHEKTDAWTNLSADIIMGLQRYGLAETGQTGASSVILFGGQNIFFTTPIQNPWTFDCDPSLLPVELISFTASAAGSIVELKWETATEVNNYGFEVERSLVTGHQSLVNWERIGFVEGHGNSNSSKQYSFADTNPASGNLQYRLKQINTDGSYEYFSTITEVNFKTTDVKEEQLPKEFALMQNYPNPFNPMTVISYQLPVSVHVELKIFDMLGNEVTTLVNGYKQSGKHDVRFDAGNLAAGVYFYKLSAGKYTAVKKLLLIK